MDNLKIFTWYVWVWIISFSCWVGCSSQAHSGSTAMSMDNAAVIMHQNTTSPVIIDYFSGLKLGPALLCHPVLQHNNRRVITHTCYSYQLWIYIRFTQHFIETYSVIIWCYWLLYKFWFTPLFDNCHKHLLKTSRLSAQAPFTRHNPDLTWWWVMRWSVAENRVMRWCYSVSCVSTLSLSS